MVKDIEDVDYIIATNDNAFHVRSITEAVYAWSVKNGTVYIKNHGKDTYKYFCNIIVDDCEAK